MGVTAAELDVIINGDGSGADAALGRTDANIKNVARSMVAAGGTMLYGTKLAVGGAMQLEQTWANTAAVTGQTIGEVTSAYTGMTADLAMAYGKSQQDIAAGIYDIAQAGDYTVSETNQIITAATKGAAAGLTTVLVATDGLTSVLNAYKYGVNGTALSVQDLNRINDINFKTVAAGKISYEELNSVIGDNAPLAAQLGVSYAELGAAYAMTTSQGVNYAETSTQINSIMSGLLKPSTALTAKLQEYGYESGLALVQQKGLAGALEFVKEATGGQADALAELFPNIRATRGLTALLNGDFDEFLAIMEGATEVIDPVTGEVIKLGATEEALGKITDTTSFQLKRLFSTLGVLANQFGTALLPFIRLGAEALAGLAALLTKLPAPIMTAIAAFVALAGTVMLAYGTFLLLGGSAGIGAAVAAVAALAGPLLLLAGLLALFAAAWAGNWFGIRDVAGRAVDWLTGKFRALGNFLRPFADMFRTQAAAAGVLYAAFFTLGALFNRLGREFPILGGVFTALRDKMQLGAKMVKDFGLRFDQLRGNLNPVAAGLTALGDVLRKYSLQFGPLRFAIGALGRAFGFLGDAAGDFGDILQAVMKGDWREAFDELKEMVPNLARGFSDLGTAALSFPFGVMVVGFDAVSRGFDSLIKYAGPFKGALEGLRDGFGNLGDAATEFASIPLSALAGDWDAVWDSLKTGLGNVGDAFGDFGRASVDALKGAWDALSGVDWSGMLSGIAGSLQNIASAAFEGLQGIGDWVLDVGIPTVGGAILGFAGTVWDWLKQGVSWLAENLPDAANAAGTFASWAIDVGLPTVSGAVVGAFGTLWDWIKDGVSWLAGTLGEGITDFANWAIDVDIPDVGGAISGAFGSAWDWIKDKVSWLTDAIDPPGFPDWGIDVPIPGVLGDIVNAFSSAWAWIKDKVSWLTDLISPDPPAWEGGGIAVPEPDAIVAGAFGSMWEWVKSKVSWLADTISCVVSKFDIDVPNPAAIGGAAGAAYGTICDWIKATIPWLADLGGSAVDLFKLQIDASVQLIGDIANWTGTIFDWLKKHATWLVALGGTVVQSIKVRVDAAAELWGDIKNWAGSMADYLKKHAAWIGDIEPKIDVDAIIDGTVTVAETLKSAVQTAVDGLVQIAQTAWDTINGIWGAITGSGGGDDDTWAKWLAAEEVAAGLESAATRIDTAVATISAALATFSGSLTVATSAASTSSQAVGTAWGTDVPTAFTTAQTGVVTTLNAIAQTMSLFVTAAGTAGTDAGTQFQTNLGTGLTAAQTAVTNAITAMQTALGQFATQAGAFGTSAGSQFKTNWDTGLTSAKTALTNAITAMQTALGQFATDAGTKGRTAGSSFRDGIQAGMSSALSAVQSAVSAIKAAMTFSGYSQGYSGGSSFGEGAYNGALSWVGNMRSAGVALGNAVVAGFNSVSKPGSPSRTARKQGGLYAEGLYVGALSWLDRLETAGTLMAGAFDGNVSATLNGQDARVRNRNLNAANGNTVYQFNALSFDDLAEVLRGVRRSNGYLDRVATTSRVGLAGTGIRAGAY